MDPTSPGEGGGPPPGPASATVATPGMPTEATARPAGDDRRAWRLAICAGRPIS